MSNKSIRNRHLREQHKPEVLQFCKDMGFSYKWIAGDWHLRIENVLDVYPTRKRYFWLPTKEWGWYEDYEGLGRIMIERMDNDQSQT